MEEHDIMDGKNYCVITVVEEHDYVYFCMGKEKNTEKTNKTMQRKS